MGMQDRACAEEADPGHDLRRDPCGVTIWPAFGSEADLRDADREMREQRGAEADENIRTEPRRLACDLTLEADRAAENGGEQQLEQQHQSQDVAHAPERRPRKRLLQEVP